MFGAVVSCVLLLLKVLGHSDAAAGGRNRHSWRVAHRNVFIYRNDSRDFTNPLNVTLSRYGGWDFKGFEDDVVRVIADNMPPYITSSNLSEALGGYLGDIWSIVEDAFKFKKKVSSIYYDTGLNIIEAGQADVMLAAAVANDKLVNVDYSQPYFYNWYHLYIKQPEARPSSSSYLKTFNAKLWFLTLGIFVILTMALWLTINFLNRICHSEPCISIPSCFLGIVSGFINQGYDLKLHSYSGRVLLIFALMLGVVLYSAMNAVLVAQLAIFDIPFPFESLDDIPVKRTHSLCLRTNSFVYNNFTDAYKNVLPHWTGVLNGRGCLDINNQTNLAKILCNDSIIFLENRVVLPNVMKNHNIECNVINFKQRYFKKDNVFLMAKSFRGKVKIDNFVKKMRTVGVLQRLEYKWIKNEQLTEIKTISSPQVTMKHIESVLHMYIIMIALSLVFLACEITHNKLFNVKRYQNNTFYN